MANKIQIMFVDDEARVLNGLRRTLTVMENEWDMHFAISGTEALAVLGAAPESFDMLVTDLRMPSMDGAELLKQVKTHYPQIIRIALSGQEDKEAILRTIGLTHQYLSKPCDKETLKSTLAQAYALRDLLAADELKKLVTQMELIPSLPSLYNKLLQELQSPESSVKTIGRIIAQDIGMTTRILQLVNSAYFGLQRYITNPVQAITFLGLNTVKDLILSIHVFAQFDYTRQSQEWLSSLQAHSLTVATFARRIAEAEQVEKWSLDYAFTAGLLHDIGKLVLAVNLPEKYEPVLNPVTREETNLLEAERQLFGATHAEVGAYLLGLWGLPHPVVEAVAFHHDPTKRVGISFGTLTAVHVANILAHDMHPTSTIGFMDTVDAGYLVQLGLTERLPVWQGLCYEKGEH